MKYQMTPEEMSRGRRIGAPLGGKAAMGKAAPTDCAHFRMKGYTSWAQHLGHLAAQSLLENHPSAISYVRGIIRKRKRR